MNDRLVLLHAILTDPNDMGARKAYADWLTERGIGLPYFTYAAFLKDDGTMRRLPGGGNAMDLQHVFLLDPTSTFHVGSGLTIYNRRHDFQRVVVIKDSCELHKAITDAARNLRCAQCHRLPLRKRPPSVMVWQNDHWFCVKHRAKIARPRTR